MKYKKLPIKGYKVLNMYPVYIEGVYNGHEPFKVVGFKLTANIQIYAIAKL